MPWTVRSPCVRSLVGLPKAKVQEGCDACQVLFQCGWAESAEHAPGMFLRPVLLALVVAFERCVCGVSAAPSVALFLGTVLLCVRGSIRFGDAQRMVWDSLQLSATALRGANHSPSHCAAYQAGINGQRGYCAGWGHAKLEPEHSTARIASSPSL